MNSTISRIMERYTSNLIADGLHVTPATVNRVKMNLMDAATKAKLDTDKLVSFDDFNLMHDVIGIDDHWNGKEFTDCFWPRCGAIKSH